MEVPALEVAVAEGVAEVARGLAQAQAQEVPALAKVELAEALAEEAQAEAEDLAPGSWTASPKPFARYQYRARRERTPAWQGCTSAGY